ncbi:hypothetical protein [Pectobacterium zantedeschiae]|uniref:Uncharacterized protein n=1 Tax=Pectobacterium zantedeschiae TaxID=2034769 RepID=A0A9X8JLV7_9GAMM|nr:hypothetical protein [Pectobacterium zantedeschiae]RYC38208.1 hypothetical protein CTN06_17580 [Pectobacterium zantedeschiae]RYC44854.1 hypothetical protein CLR69_07565 [Pectobacterium zantedeschiae]RYC50005.1 hypothetical protein CTN06_03365 [Pectobacterium zantedeschiae]
MKIILETLTKGNAKEKLSVIADLTTIAGISIATVTAGLLALVARTDKIDVGNLLGVVIISLLALAGVCCFIAVFIWVVTKISKPWGAPRGVQFLVTCAIWIFFICMFLLSISIFYDFISSIRIFF